MKNFYFTFGQAHYSEDGTAMADYYVTVTAPDYITARGYFCQHFALPIMGRPDKWSFQYEEDDFDKSYCPNGEYEHLTANEIPDHRIIKEM